MRDALSREATALASDPEIEAILAEICAVTDMGFVAVARVTEQRWIACQVEDKIDFGLEAGGELDIKQTLCNEIRECGEMIVIDDVNADPDWNRHPVPILYGFRSYASLPLRLTDGSLFGTLCAIDPEAHRLNSEAMIATLSAYADRVAAILSSRSVPTRLN